MKKSKALLKNLQKADKEYEQALRNASQKGDTSAAALLALGSIDATGAITSVAQLLNEINQSFEGYSSELFKSRYILLCEGNFISNEFNRQALAELVSQEERYSLVDRDREILVQQVIKASSKKSNGSAPEKLLSSQRELRACEVHLSEIEVDLMTNRQRIIYSSIEGRLKSLVDLGDNLIRFGEHGLENIQLLPTSANLLDNPSIDSLSPSQSASQVQEDTPNISGPITAIKNPNLKRGHSDAARAVQIVQPQDTPKPSMFTEQFSDSSIQSPGPTTTKAIRQPLIPEPLYQQQSQKKSGGFFRRLFGGGKKEKAPKQAKKHQKETEVDTHQKKSLFSIGFGSKSSHPQTDSNDNRRKSFDGWQTRTASNIKSLERDDSSDEDNVGAKYITVQNKNPQAIIADNLSRQSSVASNQSKRRRSTHRTSQSALRSNSVGNGRRVSDLPERPSSAASLPILTQTAQQKHAKQAKKTERSSMQQQKITATPLLPPKVPTKNAVSNGNSQRRRPTSTSVRHRKAVVHPNLMSIVEGDGVDQDFNPAAAVVSQPKGKGKEREHLPLTSNQTRRISANNESIAPIRKGSNRSSRSEQLPKNVSWRDQPLVQRSNSVQWASRPRRNSTSSSSDEEGSYAYNAARAKLSPLDFSTLK
ncbi:hypothetical protein E3Q23_00909 [Wallemia mellicola]|uniref:Uncharacterized protein n=1 Tax=Wallemia mellicola TaxID=1708541 RepID=A0A4T0TTQ8_9BASI|nr:hypothetical protein E3Q24_00137 [Wallemia mellicola]TIB78296.1 hypothetical protein E3Q23_00909 [Wallemia mellicola]TIC03291.1 hypothetical protein E3Q17_00991 [Wallemia mellicola]TIC03886.1 hypothetical protein E3Q16_02937 [Wallemia mellicola]TIC15729.1 hypothetical protein E3Q14_00309 [Wallemia mellicola]